MALENILLLLYKLSQSRKKEELEKKSLKELEERKSKKEKVIEKESSKIIEKLSAVAVKVREDYKKALPHRPTGLIEVSEDKPKLTKEVLIREYQKVVPVIPSPVVATGPVVMPPRAFIKKVLSADIKGMQEFLRKVNIRYPLITLNIKGRPYVGAEAHIHWDESKKAVVYEVIEPKLTEKEKEILELIKNYVVETLDIDFTRLRKREEAFEYIIKKVDEYIKKWKLKLSWDSYCKILYYLYRDLIGLEKIEPLMADPNIEDISCDGVGIPIFIHYRNPHYGELVTNIVFESKEELDDFVIKLAQRCGKSISVAQPILDGSLPDGSRVHATFGTDIARKGSNFTIRKFTERPLTPVDLIKFGTASPRLFAYFWLLIEARASILVAGGTATGKTTLLNALSLFIKPELKVVSIEDTPELRLPHPNWVPQVTRPAFGPSGYGEVTMYDLLKGALRQRPDYIIVGEVRGKEAVVLFHAMATGHAALGTIHAENMDAVINRLTTPPIALPKPSLVSLDAVIFMLRTKLRGAYVRRVQEVVEVLGYDYETDDLITHRSFEWDPMKDSFKEYGSKLLEKVMVRLGYTKEEIEVELIRREIVLRWMVKKNITDYKKFSEIVSEYYYNPTAVLERISKEDPDIIKEVESRWK